MATSRTRTFFLASLLCLFTQAQAQLDGFHFVDATSLNILGTIGQPSQPYERMDFSGYQFDPAIQGMLPQPVGIKVCFQTNSTDIAVLANITHKERWQFCAGMSLYIKQDGKWLYATSTYENPSDKPFVLIQGLEAGMKECMIYLPAFCRIHSLQVGARDGSTLTTMPNPFRHKMLVFGSSFTHGVGASHAAMLYPAQLERNLDIEVVNLGLSGNCKLQPEFAQLFAKVNPDIFLFDAFSNTSPELIAERLLPFIATIRQAHPHTPLVFMQTLYRENGNFLPESRKHEEEKRAMAERMMAQAMKQYKDVYFLNCNWTGNDHETTADGVHPSDLGYYRCAQTLTPKLRKILKKYHL